MSKMIIKSRKKEHLIQMFFLKNDETQNVEVQEGYEIDVAEVKNCLENGESVHIKQREQKPNGNFIAYQRERDLWYLVRS
jgi:hypothetical protein